MLFRSYRSALQLLLPAVIVCLLPLRSGNRQLLHATRWLLLGSLLYLALFFAKLKDHDYYFITVLPTVALLFATGFLTIKKNFDRFFHGRLFRLGLSVLLIAALLHGKKVLAHRYEELDQPVRNSYFNRLNTLRKDVVKAGVSDTSKFIVFADASPNAGLLALDHAGWSMDDTLSRKQHDSFLMYLYRGATYAVWKGSTPAGAQGYFTEVLVRDSIHVVRLERGELIHRVDAWKSYIASQPGWNSTILKQAGQLKTSYNETLLLAALSIDRKSTRLNSSHIPLSRMPSSA